MASSTTGSSAADFHRQDEWGRAVRFNSEGRPILFERTLGNGQKLLTWVV